MIFKDLYTSDRIIGREEELMRHVLNEMADWDNPKAAQVIISNMHMFHEQYGLPVETALLAAYSLCVIGSSDEGTQCPIATIPSQGTAPVETSTSVRPAIDLEPRPVDPSQGGYFELTIRRLLKLSANLSYRFGRWASRGARSRKPSGNWRMGSGAALTRKS